jgi:hypothetical protein
MYDLLPHMVIFRGSHQRSTLPIHYDNLLSESERSLCNYLSSAIRASTTDHIGEAGYGSLTQYLQTAQRHQLSVLWRRIITSCGGMLLFSEVTGYAQNASIGNTFRRNCGGAMLLYAGILSYDVAVKLSRPQFFRFVGDTKRSFDHDPSSEWYCGVSGSGVLCLHGVFGPLFGMVVVAINRS